MDSTGSWKYLSSFLLAICLALTACGQPDDPADSPDSYTPFALARHLSNSPCQPFGIVTDTHDVPVPSAQIEILVGEAAHRSWKKTGILTDEQGRYELPPQDECPPRIAVLIPNKLRGEELDCPISDLREIELRMQRDIVVSPAQMLAGVVIKFDGTPAADSPVTISSARILDMDWFSGRSDTEILELIIRNWAISTVTDDEGRFEFPAVSPDRLVIVVTATDHERTMLNVNHVVSEDTEPIEIKLKKPTCWSVRVLDHEGNALSQSVVTVSDRVGAIRDLERITTDTDGSGEAEVCEIESWAATIHAYGPGHTREFVRNETTAESVTIQLNRAATIKGKLVPYKDGDCPCHHFASGSGVGMDIEVQDDGSFTADHIRPGENRGSFHTCAGYHLTKKSWDLEPGEIRDIGSIRIKKSKAAEEQCKEQKAKKE